MNSQKFKQKEIIVTNYNLKNLALNKNYSKKNMGLAKTSGIGKHLKKSKKTQKPLFAQIIYN